MATQNLPTYIVTGNNTWVDLVGVAGLTGMASANSTIQNVGSHYIYYYFSSSASPPAAGDGQLLALGASATGNAAHLYVRALSDGRIAPSLV